MAGSDAQVFPFSMKAPLGPLRPPDAVIGGYIGLALVPLAVGAARGLAGCDRQLVLDMALLAGLGVVSALSRRSANRFLVLLRLAYVPFMFAPLYMQTATIWPVLHSAPFDAVIVHAEQALLGGQPSLVFAQRAPWPWLSEIFCIAYFAYYLFVPAMLLAALVTRGYAAAEDALFAATLCLCICFTLFWLVPTMGPLYWFPPHAGPELYRGYLFNHLIYLITSHGEVPTGAFPSSHVAVAVLLAMRARRLAPRLFPFMVCVTVLMCPAVIYLREHYAVDVPAGILMALLVDRLAILVSRRLLPAGLGIAISPRPL